MRTTIIAGLVAAGLGMGCGGADVGAQGDLAVREDSVELICAIAYSLEYYADASHSGAPVGAQQCECFSPLRRTGTVTPYAVYVWGPVDCQGPQG
ncbi:hypothetical protein LZ198_06135 [Myxococcus sp. K15C18031901]|uniref:hypothetical protein n=1 Tax=Myxococcus dinghuensis TaxID=2906761 RepID=UPI0020A7B27F|nr:hypothetical protein [Myxococcus dinghuensis]MCP3098455.1 hypothetical protein [Myxococcus dinghuensis]